MNRDDETIRELYTQLYEGTHAPSELKGKVRNMTEGKKKTARRSVKTTAAIATAAAALIAGTLVTAATHRTYIGQYTTAYINGEMVQARYGEWDTIATYIVEAEKNGKTYTAYIRGEYDKDTMPLYFRDEGKYTIASTDPEQQLNLYEDIDKAPHAKIEDNWLLVDSSFLLDGVETPDAPEELFRYYAFAEPYAEHINLELDEQDGVKDGVMKFEWNLYDTYIISPEGLVIDADKSKGSMMDDDQYTTVWGLIWGEESEDALDVYMTPCTDYSKDTAN